MSLDFSQLIQCLDCRSESDHFVLWYCLRDPHVGPGNGRRGVGNPHLVPCYLDNLERLYSALTGPLVRWRKEPKDKIHVYLLDLDDLPERSPLADLNSSGKPYLVLPCRSVEPSLQMAYQRAAVEAIHEATHAFSFSAREFRFVEDDQYVVSKRWYWFNEATSVFMEGFLMPTNPESIRFARDWSDAPQIPLDDDSATYAAGMFARYLARRFGPGFLAEMWHQSLPLETPFDILDTLVAIREPKLKSPDPRELCPIFRDYCVEAYFISDHKSVGFAADVYARFGNRALEESLTPPPGVTEPPARDLHHLACHYWRVWLATGVQRIQIDLVTGSPAIVADATIVRPDMQRQPAQPVSPTTLLEDLSPATMDHAIVVVSNIGLSGHPNPSRQYSLRFTVS